ncbi:hypothetical protein [Candidatus Ichthyocystis hellenicum]|uniref:hypothetical protein n=1 Tax=Candidatus Ichthyocystis hellenicum TaxID=1561003 RepID=UPI000B80A7D2|nr:hypothetical protein [Candidatus Ichthyocystis hellenicum]
MNINRNSISVDGRCGSDVCDKYATETDLPSSLRKIVEIASCIASFDEIMCHDHSYSHFIDTYRFNPTKYKLLQNLRTMYEHSTKTIGEVCKDDFFQVHVSKYGYNLDEDFLSVINEYKNIFASKVDHILYALHGVIPLVGEISKESVHRVCYSFSKDVCDLMDRCIGILKSDIIPAVIKDIFNSKFVDESYKRNIAYSEMERLFLHFVDSLESLVISRTLNYWRCFFNSSKLLSSLHYESDHIGVSSWASHHNVSRSYSIDCSSAFIYKFGVYISFMSVTRIEAMTSNFIGKCAISLKNLVRSKCICICHYSHNAHADIIDLKMKLPILIKKEFEKMISREKLKDNLGNFLKELVLFNQREFGTVVIEKSRLATTIIDDVCKSLIGRVNRDLLIIIGRAKCIINSYKERYLRVDKSIRTIEGKWGVRLHPEDSYDISAIRRRFSAKSKTIISNKFYAMIKEGYKFSDGIVISRSGWNEVSKNMFPIAQDVVKDLLYNERLCLFKLLSNARIVEDISIFDGCYVGTREATPEEKDSVLSIATEKSYTQTKDIIRNVWISLINRPDVCSLEDNIISDISVCSLKPEGEDDGSLDSVSLVQSKIINRWGLNIYPDDDKLILFMRRKFSLNIRAHFRKLFSGMLETGTILPSGKVLRECCWNLVSAELRPIAIKSIESIVEKEYVELDKVLAKTRIADTDINSVSYCVFREVTDDEKNILMTRSRIFIDRRITASVRLSWIDVVNTSAVRFEGESEYLGEIHIGNNWGVILRREDNFSILNIESKFSSKISGIARDKFHKIIKDGGMFENGTIVDSLDWIMVSENILPVILSEVNHLIEDENKEFDEIISSARVVIDSRTDREITNKEKSIVLENVIKFVSKKMKWLFSEIWKNVVSSLCDNTGGNDVSLGTISTAAVDCDNEMFSKSLSVPSILKVNSSAAECNFRVKLRCEDDHDILKVKKKFLSEIDSCINSKFFKMIKEKYRFSDSTVIDRSPWKIVSRKLIPIAKKEIAPVIERERIEINEILLKSLKVTIDTVGSVVTTELTCDEISSTLERIMRSVYKNAVHRFSTLWNIVVRLPEEKFLEEYVTAASGKTDCSPSVEFLDLNEVDKSELDNIRLEFFGILGSIIGEVISTLLPGASNSPSLSYDIISIITKRSRGFFKDGGFIDRVKLLLSVAKVTESSGNIRVLTNNERKYLFKTFMDSVYNDMDHLVRKRTEAMTIE